MTSAFVDDVENEIYDVSHCFVSMNAFDKGMNKPKCLKAFSTLSTRTVYGILESSQHLGTNNILIIYPHDFLQTMIECQAAVGFVSLAHCANQSAN